MANEWFEQWSVPAVVAQHAVDGWWNSTREITVVESAIKAKRNEGNKLMMQGLRGEMRQAVLAFDAAASAAVLELKERKRQLALTDSPGDAWKALFIRAFRDEYGDAAFDRINAAVQATLEERAKLRSVPMSAGSVLSPIGGSGGMKSR